MAHKYIVQRLLIVSALTASFGMAESLGSDEGAHARPLAMNTASQAAAAQSVSIEIGAIGLVGSAAWLTGLRLRRRAFGVQPKRVEDSVNG